MRGSFKFLNAAILIISAFSFSAFAQSWSFTDEKVDYSLEFPSPTWKIVSRPDGLQQQAEFIFGDRLDGYLQVRKEMVDADVTPTELASRYREEKLRFKPGYVDGKEDRFAGRLSGITVSYEFTQSGKAMVGRIYYLQSDKRTIYVLLFTGLRESLARIRNQTDLIARSLTVKGV
jgi:hypothetical protein